MLNLIRMLVSLDITLWLERPERGYTRQCLEILRDCCKNKVCYKHTLQGSVNLFLDFYIFYGICGNIFHQPSIHLKSGLECVCENILHKYIALQMCLYLYNTVTKDVK
jgi:hypothetical protein